MKQKTHICLTSFLSRQPALAFLAPEINKAFEILVAAGINKKLVMVCGNGGSSADAAHIVGEMMNKFNSPRPVTSDHECKLRATGSPNADYLIGKLNRTVATIDLSSQSGLISAIANDVAADMVFAQQVFGYGKPGDVLIALSTSGNSPNVLNAAVVARAFEIPVIAFTGEKGGSLAPEATVAFKVPAHSSAQIQEFHLPLYHVLCAMVEIELFIQD